MTKGELITSVAVKTGIDEKAIGRMIPAFLEVITDCLTTESKLQLPGFGTFEIRDRAARTGRNPQTGETIEVPACKVVGFKAGKALREAVNQ